MFHVDKDRPEFICSNCGGVVRSGTATKEDRQTGAVVHRNCPWGRVRMCCSESRGDDSIDAAFEFLRDRYANEDPMDDL